MAGPESKAQTKVMKYLKSVGCKVIKTVVNTVAGHADMIICYKGHYIEFEMKAPGKHATKLQLVKARETQEAGGHWFEIHNVEEAKEAIAKVEGNKC